MLAYGKAARCSGRQSFLWVGTLGTKSMPGSFHFVLGVTDPLPSMKVLHSFDKCGVFNPVSLTESKHCPTEGPKFEWPLVQRVNQHNARLAVEILYHPFALFNSKNDFTLQILP